MLARDSASLRAVRLRALGEAPAAFASTRELEAGYPAEHWLELATQSGLGRDAIVFVAHAHARWVGMAAARWFDRDRGIMQLWGMWVDPAARRRGLGKRLVDEVHRWAASRGARRLRLGVIEGAPGAVEFYERLGFIPTEETKTLPRDESLVALFLARPV